MMLDTQINLCEDVLHGRTADEPVTTAKTIEGGYLRRETDGTLTVTPAAMTLAQHAQFCRLAEEAFAPVMPKYQAALAQFAAGLMRLFPPHLADAGKRLSACVFRSAFADPIIREAIVSRSLLPGPTPGTFCDVLIQFK